MPEWKFEVLPPALVEHGLTQRDQFNNDEVTLAQALVREVIQNSTDAYSSAVPVKVRFALKELDLAATTTLRGFFTGLRPHLEACGVDPEPIGRSRARVLVIEDFGTKGLTGNPAARDNDNFDRFWRQHGISGKGGKSGGRWGLGKLVYSSSSEIKAFFGLTRREGDPDPLLMGQTVLANHDLDGNRHPAHGFWFGDRAPNQLQLPVSDPSTIATLAGIAGVTRTTQTGLSLVIPHLNTNVTEQTIIDGVVGNYYFPILAGKLTVEVGTVTIDRNSFHRIAAAVASGANIPLPFVEQVSSQLTVQPTYAAKSVVDGKALEEASFAAEQLAAMKADFASGKLLHVRVPIQLKPKGGANILSRIDLFLKRLPDDAKSFALFVRGSITVPGEIRYFGGAHAYGAMVASEDGVVAFLGDAENPAHTGWNASAEKLTARWRAPSGTLHNIRYALRDLYTLVADSIQREDRDALIDFFSLLDQGQSSTGKKKRTPKVPQNLPHREKALLIRSQPGGFAIVAGPGAQSWTFPKIVDVRVAYDIVSGDPFKRHHKFDFDLEGKDISIKADSAEVTPLRANKLRLSLTAADFRLEASGFDVNRDLVVDARTV
ncbi:MAG: hypothetical protein ABL962_02645 [Fimbriimonadaceae bacterium]